MIAKAIGWAVLIAFVTWVIINPDQAGTTIHGWIKDVAEFFTHLAHG